MGRGNINQRLNGLNPLAYMGDNAFQPPEFVTDNRPPTANDSFNFELGTIWLDTGSNTPPSANDVYMLVALNAGVATWVSVGGSDLETLTGNSGGPVGPDGAMNINILGDTTTINVVGNSGTNTLTISAVTTGTGLVSTLTGNSGGAVSPTAGNINVVGTGTITVVGNPGTSTLTVTPSGAIASSFPTDSGTATPSGGVLNVLGGTATRDINTSGSGNTIHVDLNNAITLGDLASIVGSPAITLTTGDATITAGNINLTNTNTAGTIGVINYSGTRWINNYGTSNVFIGNNAGNLGLTVVSSVQNIGIGTGSLGALTTGVDNVCVGTITGTLLTTGGRNVALGSGALQRATTGSSNIILGPTAALNITTGSFNFAAGDDALILLTTGSSNISLGRLAGSDYTGAETNNINIGDGLVSTNLQGTVGESNVTRIANIRGTTTTVNDAIAVLIDSTGQLGTVSSSLRYKENIHDMGIISDDIYRLRPVVFNYKKYGPEVKSVGLIAEEVEQVMPRLVVKDNEGQCETVKYHELIPLMLNEIQRLEKRLEVLESK